MVPRAAETISGSCCPQPKNFISMLLTSESYPTVIIHDFDIGLPLLSSVFKNQIISQIVGLIFDHPQTK